MATISKINYRPGKERFYGFVFGVNAAQAMKTDQEILAHLSNLNIFEALGKLHYKGLIVTEVAALIALAACGVVIQGQDRPIEAPVTAQPQIAYFTKDTIQGDPVLVNQLAGVQGLSGQGAGCNPAIVMVEGGKAGGETAGFCTTGNVIKSVVVRGERDGAQQTVNEDLITRVHQGSDGKPDVAYIEYGSGNKKGTLFTYDYVTKITTWHFPSGGTVEFPAAKGPFEELIGKLIEPGGVAAAAEIDTPTPTVTVTATVVPATPTKEIPTPMSATEAILPADFTQEIEGIYKGVNMNITIVSDSSYQDNKYTPAAYHTTIKLHTTDNGFQSDFKNKYGEDAPTALDHVIADTLWRRWGGANRGNFDYFMSKWSKAQASGTDQDWQAVEIQVLQRDGSLTTVRPGDVEIIFTDPDSVEYKDQLILLPQSVLGASFGQEIVDGKIRMLVGFNAYSQRGDERIAGELSGYFAKYLYVFDSDTLDERNKKLASDPYDSPAWKLGLVQLAVPDRINTFYGLLAFSPPYPWDLQFNK